MSLRTADYDYSLPEELIAGFPAERRDGSRMMVLHRDTQRIEHRAFTDFPSYVRPDDVAVLNDTRVIPARAFSDDGKIELLFLEKVGGGDFSKEGSSPSTTQSDAGSSRNAAGQPHVWRCLVKPGRKMRVGALVDVGGVPGVVREIEPDGERVIAFLDAVDLDRCGELPLPPYFHRTPEKEDSERYQTVYARSEGSVAAPTAGLHFTPEILARLKHTFITLHVGVGTFRPVQAEDVTGHRMHSERFTMGESAAAVCNAAGCVFAIGTTSARVLETIGRPLHATSGKTDIFIRPPYEPRVIGALLTNFHLPKSTLLMLVSALAGREFTLRAYEEAIRERYRFFSYGDCMLIV